MDLANMDIKQLREISRQAAILAREKEPPKISRKLPKVLTPDQVDKLLAVIPNSNKGKRQRAIVMVMLGCGLRVSEVCNLTSADYNPGRHTLYIQMSKGDRDRFVPMNRTVEGCIEDWLSVAPDSKWLFCSWKGTQAISRNINQMVHDISKAANVWLQDGADKKPVHPHALRHTYATELLNKGMSIVDIGKLLGHSDISTTQIYLSVSINDLISKVRRLD